MNLSLHPLLASRWSPTRFDPTHEIVEEFPRMLGAVERLQAVRLEQPERKALAAAALTLKYDDGAAPITPEQLLEARRYEDREPTLWNTFNVIQEGLTQGGHRYRSDARMDGDRYVPARRAKTRAVQGIGENTRLNKALWSLAEEMQRLKG